MRNVMTLLATLLTTVAAAFGAVLVFGISSFVSIIVGLSALWVWEFGAIVGLTALTVWEFQ